MGLTVNEDDLHLFVLCADENWVDMDKLKRVHTVKGTARAPDPSDSDDDGPTKAVGQDGTAAKAAPKKRDATSSEDDAAEGFAAALNKSAARHHGESKKKKKRDRSGSEEELDTHGQQEKQRLVMETGRIIREHNLRHFDAPSMRDSLVDVHKKYDAVMRETSVSTAVEGILSWLLMGAPVIEMMVLMKFPALKINGWSTIIRTNIDWFRDPATQLWRQHMLMFGPSCSPWVAIALLLFGSLGAVALCNYMGFNPMMCNTGITMAAFMLGMRHVPSPSQTHAAPAAAPPPPQPAQRPAPPPPSAAQGNRRTMQPPSII